MKMLRHIIYEESVTDAYKSIQIHVADNMWIFGDECIMYPRTVKIKHKGLIVATIGVECFTDEALYKLRTFKNTRDVVF